MKKITLITLTAIALVSSTLGYTLFRAPTHKAKPAQFHCLNLKEGSLRNFSSPIHNIYGAGLAYSKHINETGSGFTPDSGPPIFRKHIRALGHLDDTVNIPTSKQLITDIDTFEPGLGKTLRKKYPQLPALLDYEVELGFVLLEDISLELLYDSDYVPKLGFFIANDLSARSLAVLGEGSGHREDYWGVSKSFNGFLPMIEKYWIPTTRQRASIPCITIETIVNGKIRQRESTSNMIYTPKEILVATHKKFPNQPLRKGDLFLTGTPGGIALYTPRWLTRLSNLIGLDRFSKLSAILRKDRSPFLKDGDVVEVRGQGLGSVSTKIVRQK
ncbi:MAG: fumarylacetoacetate hydrolase family protein [Spirochaetota bacterium]